MKSKRKPCYASKGLPKVPGKPKGTDIIPAWLTPGEAVLSPGAAEMLGRGNVQALNKAASTMRLGTPQYKAEGEDEMQPDYAMLGNQRAAEILSNSNLFNGREVQAANRYMDPAGLAGGPSLARDQAFLGGTRSLESANNPADESLRKQIAQAQQGLFGGNRPMRLGNDGDDGTSEGLQAAQEAIGSALSYGRQAAQEAAQEGQGAAQSAIRDANERARYMSQGGIVQPGYYADGITRVGEQNPMYPDMPTVTQTQPQLPQPAGYAAGQQIRQSLSGQNERLGKLTAPLETGMNSLAEVYKRTGNAMAGGTQRLANAIDQGQNAVTNFAAGAMGMQPIRPAPSAFRPDTTNPAPNRVGTGAGQLFPDNIRKAMPQPNRGSFGADIANATGKPSTSTAPDASGIYNANAKTGGYDRAPELARLKTDPRTGNVATDRNGFASLEFINKAARDAVMGGNAREQQLNQASPIQQNNPRASYLGGLRMPWNVGDMVTMKDNGISYMGVAKPDGFSQTSGMTLPFLMRDPGIRSAIEAQNSMYTSNKSLADANDSNAQAAIRPMQGLGYLSNAMGNAAQGNYYQSQANKLADEMQNPEKYARLGSGSARSNDLGKLYSVDIGQSKYLVDPNTNQMYGQDDKGNLSLVNLPSPPSEQDKDLIQQYRSKRPDWANLPDDEIWTMIRNGQASLRQKQNQ